MPHYQVVRYKNEINKLNLTLLNPGELNIFIAMLSLVKNKGIEKIEVDYDNFRKMARVDKNVNDNEFGSLVINTLSKVGAGSILLDTEQKFMMFAIFDRVEVDKVTKKMSFNLSDTFVTYFNNFLTNYTSFPLNDFIEIKSKYAKLLYKALMQFNGTGRYYENYDKFVSEVLEIPSTTARNNINYKYITPSVERIRMSGAIPDLRVNLIKKQNKTVAIEFAWTPVNISDRAKGEPADIGGFYDELSKKDKKKKTQEVLSQDEWDEFVSDSTEKKDSSIDDDLPF